MNLAALILLWGLFALLPLPALAQEASCPNFAPTEVVVKTFFDRERIDQRHGLAGLRELSEAEAVSILAREHPAGLTLGEMVLDMNYDIQSQRGQDGRFCSSITSIQVDFGFRDTVIYIARELPRRSCPYREVLNHEMTHVSVDKKMLKDFAPKIKQFLRTAANNIGTTVNLAAEDSQLALKAQINDKLSLIAKEVNEVRSLRQAAVDTEEEYERVSASCNGQLRQILDESLRRLDAAKHDQP